MTPFKPGDKVFYIVHDPSRRGATRRAAAVIVKVQHKTASIALFDRTMRHILYRRVALANLEPRESDLILDVELASRAALASKGR